MTSFATLPADVRRAIARRELRRRGIDADQSLEQFGAAYGLLLAALRALLPDDPPVFVEGSRCLLWPQPALGTHTDKLDALAVRIEADALTTGDLAVLCSLPTNQLAIVGMSPTEFVGSVSAAWASC